MLTLLFFSALPLGNVPLTNEGTNTSIQALTDFGRPVPGAPVHIVDGQTNGVLTTGLAGATQFTLEAPGSVLELRIGEGVVREGTTLGIARALAIPTATTVEDNFVYSTTQPTLQAVIFSPHDPEFYAEDAVLNPGAEGDYARTVVPPIDGAVWTGFVPRDAPYTYSAQVATLVDSEEIAAVFNFRNSPRDVSGYRCGLVIRTAQDQLVPDLYPLAFKVNATDYAFTSTPSADVVLFPADGATSVDVTSTFTVGEAELDGAAVVSFRGVLHKGDTVILIRDGAQATPSRLEVELAEVNPMPAGGGTSAPTGQSSGPGGSVFGLGGPAMAQDCIVPKPDPPEGWTCSNPGVAVSMHEVLWSDDCDWVNLGLAGCDVSTLPSSNRVCKVPGSTRSKHKTRRRTHKFTVPVKIGDGLQEVYSYTHETEVGDADTWTAAAGEYGHGECHRDFVHSLICAYRWDWPENGVRWEPREWIVETYWGPVIIWRTKVKVVTPCSESRTRMSFCTDESESEQVCSRTN
jgi:hypothetical protein